LLDVDTSSIPDPISPPSAETVNTSGMINCFFDLETTGLGNCLLYYSITSEVQDVPLRTR